VLKLDSVDVTELGDDGISILGPSDAERDETTGTFAVGGYYEHDLKQIAASQLTPIAREYKGDYAAIKNAGKVQAMEQEYVGFNRVKQEAYSEDSLKQMAAANVSATAKAYDASYDAIKNAGKLQQLIDENMQLTNETDAKNEQARIDGNNLVRETANRQNAKLKADGEEQYAALQLFTKSKINSTKENYINVANALKLAHAQDCKKLMAEQPYNKNTSQYQALIAACATEDGRNLDPATVERPNSRDNEEGPYEENPTVTPQDQQEETTEENSD